MNVLIYVNTNKQVGDVDHLKVFATDPPIGHVTPLSDNAKEYDFTNDVGNKHLGRWLDRAAQRAEADRCF